MEIAGLYRYPAKSMGGEVLEQVAVTSIGPVGDRNWAVVDTTLQTIRSAKQWPELLRLRATYRRSPVPDAYDGDVSDIEIHSPDGSSRSSDDADVDAWLSEQLGRPCRLSARRPAHDREHYLMPRARTSEEIASELDLVEGEVLPDFGATDDELILSLQTSATPPGSYVDAYPVHLVTSRSLDTFSSRSGLAAPIPRFRPNVLIDVGDELPGADAPELDWLGKTIQLGEVVLEVRSPTLRCSMPARPQPLLGIDADPAMTRALVHHASRLLGVNAVVVRPGTLRVGDRVSVHDTRPDSEEDLT